MGFFQKFKKQKSSDVWSDAYPATPKFYEKPDGTSFGAFALTEGTKTILPKAPQERYEIDGKTVSEWRLVLVSTTQDSILDDCDYFDALGKLERHVLDSTEKTVLIEGLSLEELNRLTN